MCVVILKTTATTTTTTRVVGAQRELLLLAGFLLRERERDNALKISASQLNGDFSGTSLN